MSRVGGDPTSTSQWVGHATANAAVCLSTTNADSPTGTYQLRECFKGTCDCVLKHNIRAFVFFLREDVDGTLDTEVDTVPATDSQLTEAPCLRVMSQSHPANVVIYSQFKCFCKARTMCDSNYSPPEMRLSLLMEAVSPYCMMNQMNVHPVADSQMSMCECFGCYLCVLCSIPRDIKDHLRTPKVSFASCIVTIIQYAFG